MIHLMVNTMQKKEIEKIYRKYSKYCKYLVFVIFLVISAYFYKRIHSVQKSQNDMYGEESLAYLPKEQAEEGIERISSDMPARENTIADLIDNDIAESDIDIYVYICGSIQNPDVYALPKGSRLVTLIDMAGGFTGEADRNILNLAKVLEDGERIYVPNIEEAVTYISQEHMGNSKVDINRATKEELMRLKGIGESRAQDIIAYRENHGRFGKIEDIMQVSGIKQSVFEKIKDSIEVN